MAPPPPQPPPPLVEDLTAEILLRLPPDDPACLVLAAAVCKPWLRLLAGPAFARRYSEFHRTPPLLGFVLSPRFVPAAAAAAASPICTPAFGCHSGWPLDCRHGRALLHAFHPGGLVVWDPVAGDHQRLPLPAHPYCYHAAAVLCAADGCGHLDCRGAPFLVVFVGTGDAETWACLYSSETGAWSAPTSIRLDSDFQLEVRPSLLAGGALHFTTHGQSKVILKYDLGRHDLSVIRPPPVNVRNMVLMAAEDGGELGVAAVEGGSLHICSWRGGPDGIAGWAHRRVIELKPLLPVAIGDPSTNLRVVGFAEGADIIFMSTNVGVFAFELKSSRFKKVLNRSEVLHTIFPYMSFYTPDHAAGRLPPPERVQ